MKQVLKAVVSNDEATEIIPLFKSKGYIDLSARITSENGIKYIPIKNEFESEVKGMGFETVSGNAYSESSRPPMEKIKEELSGLPSEMLALLPEKWEIAGTVVTLKMDERLFAFSEKIGKAYADAIGVRSVLADVSGVSGEFREPDMRLLYGEIEDSVKIQNGIKYCYNVTKVMFASGNLVERRRMKELDCRGETVVDMFAGIGYFTLPLAKYSGARRVFACEKNPNSYRFLIKNIELNELTNVIPLLGDNRDIAGKCFADRILMGYVQITSEFVSKALEMAKPGCIIHYHDTFPVGKEMEMTQAIFEKYCVGRRFKIENMREVKSFAPSVSHYVADIRIY